MGHIDQVEMPSPLGTEDGPQDLTRDVMAKGCDGSQDHRPCRWQIGAWPGSSTPCSVFLPLVPDPLLHLEHSQYLQCNLLSGA